MDSWWVQVVTGVSTVILVSTVFTTLHRGVSQARHRYQSDLHRVSQALEAKQARDKTFEQLQVRRRMLDELEVEADRRMVELFSSEIAAETVFRRYALGEGVEEISESLSSEADSECESGH
ncbi:hypothetical protein [Streptomyces sp. NBC_00519]|uniref:hypothetical protein n=1 Tax=Streptomyces sp. NBC_00519 TaxID=2975764 RepID=UPI0030E1D106